MTIVPDQIKRPFDCGFAWSLGSCCFISAKKCALWTGLQMWLHVGLDEGTQGLPPSGVHIHGTCSPNQLFCLAVGGGGSLTVFLPSDPMQAAKCGESFSQSGSQFMDHCESREENSSWDVSGSSVHGGILACIASQTKLHPKYDTSPLSPLLSPVYNPQSRLQQAVLAQDSVLGSVGCLKHWYMQHWWTLLLLSSCSCLLKKKSIWCDGVWLVDEKAKKPVESGIFRFLFSRLWTRGKLVDQNATQLRVECRMLILLQCFGWNSAIIEIACCL